MPRIEVSSCLRAAPEKVWSILQSRGVVAEPSCQPWPRASSTAARSVLLGRWHHYRLLRQIPDGCEVLDCVDYEPRFRMLSPAVKWFICRRIESHHTKLRSRFGVCRSTASSRSSQSLALTAAVVTTNPSLEPGPSPAWHRAREALPVYAPPHGPSAMPVPAPQLKR